MKEPRLEEDRRLDLVILIPVYNDWRALAALMKKFEPLLANLPEQLHFLIVDDGSTALQGGLTGHSVLGQNVTCGVLRLVRNLGHQRAIAVGLCHIFETYGSVPVAVMDGDGEDDPSALVQLLDHPNVQDAVVFAARRRRSEGLVFVLCYHLYRTLHWLLTGVTVRFGNFSVIPPACLQTLVVSPELWNHYAATVLVSGFPYRSLPIDRATRLDGRSHMNFTALAVHGLGALSVYRSVVGTRVVLLLGSFLAMASLSFVIVFAARLSTSFTIPGWASVVSGLLLLLMVQILGMALFFVFGFLGSRSQPDVVPIRDYHWYLGSASETRVHG